MSQCFRQTFHTLDCEYDVKTVSLFACEKNTNNVQDTTPKAKPTKHPTIAVQ